MSDTQPIRDQVHLAARDQLPQPWCVETRQGRLAIQVATLGAIGLSVNHLTYTSPRLTSRALPELLGVCRQLAERIAYLLEPIRVIETDEDLGTVQMRSEPPSREKSTISYYELLARAGGELRLVRYRKAAGQSREAIPSDITFQVLERLAGDFDAV